MPRFGLKSIVVNGTAHDDLTKGPGRELHTYMPGEGELIYVAGHRTTYLAPFAHIDSLKPGDRITFQLPYATFDLRGHRPQDRHRRRPRRSPVAPQGAARPPGLPPAVLRDAPLPGVREARPRRAPRRRGLRRRQVRPDHLDRWTRAGDSRDRRPGAEDRLRRAGRARARPPRPRGRSCATPGPRPARARHRRR